MNLFTAKLRQFDNPTGKAFLGYSSSWLKKHTIETSRARGQGALNGIRHNIQLLWSRQVF